MEACNISRLYLIALVVFVTTVLMPNVVLAHCPLCSAATGAIVIATRWYGLDDLIIGTVLGAFIISTAYWINNWLKRRNKGKNYLPWQLLVLILATYLSTIFTFQFSGLLGNLVYQLYGVDKLAIGTTLGTLITIFTFILHDYLRKINGNRNYLPFQPIVLTLVFLGIASISFYLIGVVV